MSKFFLTCVQVAKKILMIGEQALPAVVSAYNAPLGALIGTIVQSVTTVQAQSAGTVPGATKKDNALAIVQAAMPAIEQIFEANSKAIQNPELFAAGVEKLQDGLVDIFNSTGQGTKPVTAAAA